MTSLSSLQKIFDYYSFDWKEFKDIALGISACCQLHYPEKMTLKDGIKIIDMLERWYQNPDLNTISIGTSEVDRIDFARLVVDTTLNYLQHDEDEFRGRDLLVPNEIHRDYTMGVTNIFSKARYMAEAYEDYLAGYGREVFDFDKLVKEYKDSWYSDVDACMRLLRDISAKLTNTSEEAQTVKELYEYLMSFKDDRFENTFNGDTYESLNSYIFRSLLDAKHNWTGSSLILHMNSICLEKYIYSFAKRNTGISVFVTESVYRDLRRCNLLYNSSTEIFSLGLYNEVVAKSVTSGCTKLLIFCICNKDYKFDYASTGHTVLNDVPLP